MLGQHVLRIDLQCALIVSAPKVNAPTVHAQADIVAEILQATALLKPVME